MNTRDLQYFVSICETGNFSKTAAQFFVSQPSITMAIHRLEDELNTKLLERDTSRKAVIPTTNGKKFKEHANRILLELKEAKLAIQDTTLKRIKLGIPPIIETYLFPPVLKKLFESNLLNQVEFIENATVSNKEKLLKGDIDIALISSLQPIKEKYLVSELIKKERFVVCVAPNHHLANKKEVYFSELKDEQFFLLSAPSIHSEAFHKMCEKKGIKPNVIYETQEFQTIKTTIASLSGVGMMLEIATDPTSDLVTIPLKDDDQLYFHVSVCYRKHHTLTKEETKVIQTIRQYL